MKLAVIKFGDILISRPAGREAYLAAKSFLKPKDGAENIEIDFSGVKVVAPSWADEFITGLRNDYPNRIIILPSTNPSVTASIKIIDEDDV